MKQYVVNIVLLLKDEAIRIATFTFNSDWKAVDFIEKFNKGIIYEKQIFTEFKVVESEEAND